MNKNTDAVPAGVAALYADIIAHPAEEWKASGSELPYLEWVEERKSQGKVFKVRVLVVEKRAPSGAYSEYAVVGAGALLSKEFTTKAAAEKFVAELEDFA